MLRILLFMEHKENCRLLAEWLAEHHRVLVADSEQDLNQPFDLCVVDSRALDGSWQAIRARRGADAVLFLPFLLVTSRQNAGLHTRQLWQGIDEFITLPAEKVELQVRVEILLRARRQSVELKRRNDDLEALAQALGHDLRAPVRIAGSFAQALLKNEQEPLGEHNRRYANRIRSAVTDMEAIITSLLALSRLGREEVQLKPVAARSVVDSCLRSLETDIQAREANVHVSDDLPIVQADTLLLKMALTNLISNALKFVAPGTPPTISIFGSRTGDLCRIQVQDNGVGIPAEDQGRVFEPFVRLYGEEDYAGVGLGLPTVRKAVELMGGREGVMSVPGNGSTFWIELPACEAGDIDSSAQHLSRTAETVEQPGNKRGGDC